MNIEIKHLYKKFPDFQLKDININIEKGKIVGLIGENGAGKTTLIKCILNIMKYDKGEVLILGKPYHDSVKQLLGVELYDSFFNLTYTLNDINLIMKNIYKRWDSKLYYKYSRNQYFFSSIFITILV